MHYKLFKKIIIYFNEENRKLKIRRINLTISCQLVINISDYLIRNTCLLNSSQKVEVQDNIHVKHLFA